MNLLTFAQAYPEIFNLDSGCCSSHILAKDFSAYYVGAWRLFHDTGNIYSSGTLTDGGPNIYPMPETFKYLPSFLLLVSPFLTLGYQSALVVFDCLQLLMLPVMAFLMYRLVRGKGAVVTVLAEAVVLIQPSPLPHWGLSAPYFWQWAEGQPKVLETFLFLLCFYAGSKARPYISGGVYGMTFFDPRFTLVSFPLFLVYNKLEMRRALSSFVVLVVITNFAFLIPGVATGFVAMLLDSGITTPPYYYSFIPLLTIICLTILNAKEVASLPRKNTEMKSQSSPQGKSNPWFQS